MNSAIVSPTRTYILVVGKEEPERAVKVKLPETLKNDLVIVLQYGQKHIGKDEKPFGVFSFELLSFLEEIYTLPVVNQPINQPVLDFPETVEDDIDDEDGGWLDALKV